MAKRISHIRRPGTLLPMIGAIIMAVIVGGTYAVSAAAASPASTTRSATAYMSAPVRLTAAQTDALAAAHRANPKLTEAQARAVLARVQAQSAPQAVGTTTGPCGHASLFGYPSGNYGYGLFFDTANVGNPWLGTLDISTDGLGASIIPYNIPPTSGAGDLPYTGIEPEGTTASGWAITTDGWFCGITIYAKW